MVILVALHDESTLILTVNPGDSNEVLLRRAQQHQGTDPGTKHGDPNGKFRLDGERHVHS
jgi:hypothetical protein